jgi:predicted nucleic acid-binding protein
MFINFFREQVVEKMLEIISKLENKEIFHSNTKETIQLFIQELKNENQEEIKKSKNSLFNEKDIVNIFEKLLNSIKKMRYFEPFEMKNYILVEIGNYKKFP